MSDLMELQTQIELLQKQATELKVRDFDKTVLDIREKMAVFGITVKDIQTVKRGPRSGKAKKDLVGKVASVPGVKKVPVKTVAAKFRGPNGETWSGRGLSPRWLALLVEQGASRDDFAIKN